ncbi:choice-of-anchor O protein [Wenzhouxiangella marina]|uniref:Uncharacterized protein n=1 Tax=Wenzhouxiangella marina TaxID=1579979 RepID=A0A0K0XS59_9GAMM|nr:choice-of-anchor O protein [Wenzhouxiangella marina]AKS40461.1 hypothetical protein WM2015_70 [Wenzhouxiangella marina]MBB6088217.1 hypothetical protein [Wenzhouxiangella marina]
MRTRTVHSVAPDRGPKSNFIRNSLASGLAIALLAGGPALADDGAGPNGVPGSRFERMMTDNLTPGGEASHAFIDVMRSYIPAQRADGTLVTDVPRYNIDGDQVDVYSEARPQIGVFVYGDVEYPVTLEGIGFAGHGKREAYAAVTLDDGLTWKRTDLSESSDLSSADFDRPDVALYADDGINYPGDVINIFQATAGNQALVAWFSRYCDGGEPNYTLESSDPTRRDAIAAYMGIDLNTPSPDDLYLIDMFLVAGSQGSVDYAQDQFEQNHPVGEVPFSCLWTARGSLELMDDGTYDMIWRKAERLTSGRRDVNRVEVAMVEGAGAVITWQEDPEGLRAGQGEGPGEGWSGAVANSQTDVWYSYIEWEYFDEVQQDDGTIVEYAAYTGESNRPKPGIPFAMPMRLTDNAPCNVDNPAPYCNGSALVANNPGLPDPVGDYGMRDMCAQIANATVRIGQERVQTNVCVTEDGLPLVGNTASTRPRVGLYGFDSNDDDITDSGWVVLVAEESKGLGQFGVDTETGIVGCDPEVDANCETFDIGKNMWYHSFSMALSDTSVEESAQLIENLGSHGNMLNQPEIDWETGTMFAPVSTGSLWDFDTGNFDIYRTEIARRGSLLAQPFAKVATTALSDLIFADRFESTVRLAGAAPETLGLVAFPTWKQGAMQQGGPADVMARRILLPADFDDTTNGVKNPYAFTNMACDTWAYADGSNPFYPDGLCLDPAINLSSVTPDVCFDTSTLGSTACPTVDPVTGIGDTNPILEGSDIPEPNTTKVLTWHQCQPGMTGGTAVSAAGFDGLSDPDASFTCEDSLTNRTNNLTDQSWYNPLDVAKGHRGFLDGDFVMMLYAWAPNWKLNSRGQDRYQLYIRRSFDGGLTWTTLPADYTDRQGISYGDMAQGTVHCEIFRGQGGGTSDEPVGCYGYGAGAPEQARNVSQLKSQQFTILDPRYSPTPNTIVGSTDPADIRDASRYFIVYETGDNSTVEEGEAEPLDLFYGRGIRFGDHYTVWAEDTGSSDPNAGLENCYPNDLHDVTSLPANYLAAVPGSGFCNEFDPFEGAQGLASGEASLEASPDGSWLYGVWGQDDELTGESDAVWRKVRFIPDYISDTYSWSLPGTASYPGDNRYSGGN